jgi:hypothetical protein
MPTSNIIFTDSDRTDDALDRRAALNAAIAVAEEIIFRHSHTDEILLIADRLYGWLRERDSLSLSLSIRAGQPQDQQPSLTSKG